MGSEKLKIDRDWCRQWLTENIFKLRPEGYRKEHPIWPGMVGIEIEMMPFDKDSLQNNPQMIALTGKGGLQDKLDSMLKQNRLWKPEFHPDGVMKRITLGDGDQLTFEPGGQLEYSSRPYPCLDDACKRVKLVQQTLGEHMEENGVHMLQSGSNPWQSAEQIGLQMAKPRYRAMNQYFSQIGPYGKRMMRETCTIQVNLDFGDTEDKMARRYLAANLVSPILTSIFSNSPVSEGGLNGLHSQRAAIWQNLDKGRTGFPKLTNVRETLSQESCVDAYLDQVLDASVVFIEALDFKVLEKPRSFSSWMSEGVEGVFPTEADFETHLSLHFPEVRARGFMELRSIDSQGVAWQLIPACVVTGLLYDDESLEKTLDLMAGQVENLPDLWKSSVKGLSNVVLRELATKIMYLAQEGFRRLPSCYQGTGKGKLLDTFAENFTLKGRTPADDIIDTFKRDGKLSGESLFSIHQRWLDLIL